VLRRDRSEVLRSAGRTVRDMPSRVARVPAHIRWQSQQITRRVRQRITGEEDTRVRDHFRSRLEEPIVIRFRDKVSFFLGVVGCGTVEYFVLAHPQLYPYCYAAFAVTLIGMRLHIYRNLKWHLFLCDFCYFVNLLCLVQILLPTSRHLLLINFAHAMGPLAVAIPTWRNSLVFHSLDKAGPNPQPHPSSQPQPKPYPTLTPRGNPSSRRPPFAQVTSVFIHGAPGLLLFCLRWYPPPLVAPLVADPVTFKEFFALGMGGYLFWQLSYVFITELLYGRALATNFDMMTSTRWLTTPPYTGITAIAYQGCRACAVMRPGELFDSEGAKTKAIFMAVQLLYTAVTLLPVPLLWNSFPIHLAYLLATYSICIWNGGSYYIEVFSKAYRTQFEGDAAARRAKAIDALGAPKRPTKPAATPRSGSSSDLQAAASDAAAASGVAAKKDD